MTRDIDGTRNPRAFFGAELRRLRMAASMSQADLGQRINYSGDMVGRVEACERSATPVFAAACDEVFTHLDGHFTRLLELARRSAATAAAPQWFRPWLEIEREATTLYWWEPLLIPGLLQTPDYARALFRAWQAAGATEDDIEELVSARMDRQAILHRQEPPELIAILDEQVLRRLIGSPEVMRGQSLHLAEMSQRPGVTIQVVPAEIGAHTGLAGAFIVAAFDSSPSILYAETAVEGQTIDKPALVRKAVLAFDRLRAQALPAAASRDLIRKVADERWHD